MKAEFLARLARVALALVAVGTALPVTAQSVPGLDDPRLSSIRENVEPLVAEALAADLPAEWIVDKALEGISKRVPGPLIIRALRQLLARMGEARALLAEYGEPYRPRGRTSMLAAATEAMAVGATRAQLVAIGDNLGSLSRRRRAHLLELSFRQVAELGERGFSIAISVQMTTLVVSARNPQLFGLVLERLEAIGAAAAEDRDSLLTSEVQRLMPDAASTQAGDRPNRGLLRRESMPHDDTRARGRGRGAAVREAAMGMGGPAR